MHSMTGFGRGAATTEAFSATVEITAVNRKQSEVVVQGTRDLVELEPKIRRAVASATSRGRLQVTVRLDAVRTDSSPVRVDTRLGSALEQAFQELSIAIGRPLKPVSSDFLRQPGVFLFEEGGIDAEAAWLAVEPALEAALEQLLAMRLSEGDHLKDDLLARLATLEAFAAALAAEAPARPARQRELLLKRLREAGLDLDPADERVLKELAVFADRCDISEEITRLGSHFRKFRGYLDGTEPPGRALDFLCQELFREFNTIGSKANDAGIAQIVVEAKTELEKIREQVQNVE
ncbi:MAG TPA: YicC/YloC family endoribonuclease [Luteolibacter sp.]